MSTSSMRTRAGLTTESAATVQSPRPYPHGSLYKEDTVIGNGAYGTVYKAHDLNDPSREVALKKVRIPMNEDGIPVSILREISLVRQLDRFKHPNIIRFLDVCHGPRNGSDTNPHLILYLVFEFIDMDLSKYILTASADELTVQKIKDITFQILTGVDFLHGQRIIHRDIKPQNLLISKTGQIKLADFGLAKIYDFSSRLTTIVVTLWYRSPEVLLGSSYGTPVDLWSIGCIFAELYRRRALFPGSSERDQIDKIFDIIGTPEENEWPSDTRITQRTFPSRPPRLLDTVVPGLCPLGQDLLQKLITFNPSLRVTARAALQHPFFIHPPPTPPHTPEKTLLVCPSSTVVTVPSETKFSQSLLTPTLQTPLNIHTQTPLNIPHTPLNIPSTPLNIHPQTPLNIPHTPLNPNIPPQTPLNTSTTPQTPLNFNVIPQTPLNTNVTLQTPLISAMPQSQVVEPQQPSTNSTSTTSESTAMEL